MSAHLATHQHLAARRRRRRWPLVVVVVVLAIASVAAAVLLSRQDSAPDTISALAIGNVDIGDAATNGVFVTDLTGISPGFTETECMVAGLTDPQPGVDAPRIYAADASGAMASSVNLTVMAAAASTGLTPGNLATCDGLDFVTLYDGTSAGFAAAMPSYASGAAWPGVPLIEAKFTITLPSTVDPATIAGQSASLSVAFENQPAP